LTVVSVSENSSPASAFRHDVSFTRLALPIECRARSRLITRVTVEHKALARHSLSTRVEFALIARWLVVLLLLALASPFRKHGL
jgi:hypothetical protein